MTTLDRRTLLAAAATAPLIGLGAAPARAARGDHGDAAILRQRVTAFLSALPPDKRARATFPWDGPAWRDWNYFFQDTTRFVKPGLRLEEMTEAEKDLAWDAADAVMSDRGLEKARLVMLQQAYLASLNRGRDERHPERFSFAVHGMPAPTGAWGFRIVGHHLVISFVVEDDRITRLTPTAFASHPNRMLGKRHALQALVEEDTLARRLVAELSGTAVGRHAVLGTEPLWEIVTVPGRERAITERQGVPVADLPFAQRVMAEAVLNAFCVEHLAPPLAESVARRIEAASDVHFMAAGRPEVGQPLYYRFHAAGFIAELAPIDDEAQHLHTAWHEF